MLPKSKRLMSAELVEKHQDQFRCPLCKKPMQAIQLQRLVCGNHHSFDIAKHGYINLLPHGNSTKYDKKMFEHRRLISKSGLFHPLHAAISQMVMNRQSGNEPISMLDAGCGEGSHLTNIQNEISRKTSNAVRAVGIDISKAGIRMAAVEYSEAVWCVADLANCPFASRQFNCILNILSPANYSEFGRLIAENGMIIKVVPDQDYLKELREIFYHGDAKQVYSNSRTTRRFNDQFELLAVERIQYQADLSEPLIEPLLGMTPLSWGTSKERIAGVYKMNLKQVTMDFKILIGKN